MDPISGTLLAILFSIIAFVTYQAWKVNQFWKIRNIPYAKPWLFVGNFAPLLFQQKTAGQCHEDIAKKFPNEPVIGIFDFMKPVLLVKDVDMVEKVLIKDFVHFVDRGFPVDENRNPLDSNLVTMTGKRWKATRNKLSPIFTTGKLKLMFESMSDCGDELVSQIGDTKEIEMKDILERFAMDVIGSCAFGIEAKNLSKPDNEFRRMGKKAFNMDFMQFAKFIIMLNFPSLLKTLNLTFNKPKVVEYFKKIINNTLNYRREKGFKRNDFVQLMMQLQDKGFVEVHTKDPDDDYLNINPTYSTEKFELTNDQLTGQAFTFLTAGFEANTLTIMYTLYEFSKHLEIQEKAREEVKRQLLNQGDLHYDNIKEMDYLEQCIKETMRKYPPSQMLLRICTKEYVLPNGTQLHPGQRVVIPVKAVHYDPNYYPHPEKYVPERFAPDNTLPPCAFLPFGNGPRMCIGMRFAMLQMKYCIAKLLMNYSFKISPKTKEPLTVKVISFFTAPNEKIIFEATKLNT